MDTLDDSLEAVLIVGPPRTIVRMTKKLIQSTLFSPCIVIDELLVLLKLFLLLSSNSFSSKIILMQLNVSSIMLNVGKATH